MKRPVVTMSGTFGGGLHPGHLHFLNKCKKRGNVVVFLLDDVGIRRQKNCELIYEQGGRRANLLRIGLVPHVLDHGPDQEITKQAIIKLVPDIYCFSSDQTSAWNIDLEERLKHAGVKALWLTRFKPELYSTSLLHFDCNSKENHV